MSRLLERVREAVRTRHYSHQTEKAYTRWIRRYIFFHGLRRPGERGAAAQIVLPKKVNPVFSYYGLCSESPPAVFLRVGPSRAMEPVINRLPARVLRLAG